jgi:hypothetical protein
MPTFTVYAFQNLGCAIRCAAVVGGITRETWSRDKGDKAWIRIGLSITVCFPIMDRRFGSPEIFIVLPPDSSLDFGQRDWHPCSGGPCCPYRRVCRTVMLCVALGNYLHEDGRQAGHTGSRSSLEAPRGTRSIRRHRQSVAKFGYRSIDRSRVIVVPRGVEPLVGFELFVVCE